MSGKKALGIAGAATCVTLLLGVAACGSQTTGNDSGNHQRPVATQPAPAHQAPSMADRTVTWWGTAKGQANAIERDMRAVAKDAPSLDSTTLSADGKALIRDAGAAKNNPPPGNLAGPWCAAMEHYRAAGQALCDGELITATHEMNRAVPHLNTFTNRLGKVIGN